MKLEKKYAIARKFCQRYGISESRAFVSNSDNVVYIEPPIETVKSSIFRGVSFVFIPWQDQIAKEREQIRQRALGAV